MPSSPANVWAMGSCGPKPIWLREPNLDAILATCKEVLSDSACMISFLAEGAFNKTYVVVTADQHKYVIRVSLPVHPKKKTISEVTTLRWLKAHTSIPVPGIIDFNADADSASNKIGFEWIVMEFMEGQPLYYRWRSMSLDQKLAMAKEIACMHAQLLNLPLQQVHAMVPADTLGALVDAADMLTPSTEAERSLNPVACASGKVPREIEVGAQEGDAYPPSVGDGISVTSYGASNSTSPSPSIIHSDGSALSSFSDNEVPTDGMKPVALETIMAAGSVTSIEFFFNNRLAYDIPRGPFPSSNAWLSAYLQTVTRELEANLATPQEDEDEEDLESRRFALEACGKLQAAIAIILPMRGDLEDTALTHHDLNENNILISPSGIITAIIDWEAIIARPLWAATVLPLCFADTTTWPGPQPDKVDYSQESPNSIEMRRLMEDDRDTQGIESRYWGNLECFEKIRMIGVYEETMRKLYPKWNQVVAEAGLKRDLLEAIGLLSLETCSRRIAKWADQVAAGGKQRLDGFQSR